MCAVTLKLYTHEVIHTILTLHLDLHQETTLAITKWRVHQYIFSSHIVVCNFWFSMSIKKSASTINRLPLYFYCTGCWMEERNGSDSIWLNIWHLSACSDVLKYYSVAVISARIPVQVTIDLNRFRLNCCVFVVIGLVAALLWLTALSLWTSWYPFQCLW